jgi:hypothetical protein
MIKHIVALDLRPDHNAEELAAIMQGLDDMRAMINGFDHFEHGPNRDFETKSPQFDYGFVCQFATQQTAQAYLLHPVHQGLGGRLVAQCKDGAAGIMVIDLDVAA